MAILNGKNYAKSVAFPIEKSDPNEVDARVKSIHETYTMAAVLANGDEILGPKLPEGAKIIDAMVVIDKSMGAGGILDMGLKEYTDLQGVLIVEDQNSLVNQADAGGQAVVKRADVTSLVGLGKDIGKGGAQLFAKCTEASTTTDNVIDLYVSYQIPS